MLLQVYSHQKNLKVKTKQLSLHSLGQEEEEKEENRQEAKRIQAERQEGQKAEELVFW